VGKKVGKIVHGTRNQSPICEEGRDAHKAR
jgi:hypothetical protein